MVGVGYVDMWIGVVGDQCICMFYYFGCDVGVQVEVCDQWYVFVDDMVYLCQDFVFVVVKMFCYYGVVQVEIDCVEWVGGCDVVYYYFDDMFEGVFCDMCGWICVICNCWNEVLVVGFGVFDEVGEFDIDVVYYFQDVGVFCYFWLVVVMDEIGVSGFGWSEGVGFVQEVVDGDMGY